MKQSFLPLHPIWCYYYCFCDIHIVQNSSICAHGLKCVYYNRVAVNIVGLVCQYYFYLFVYKTCYIPDCIVLWLLDVDMLYIVAG